ncbi:MAG: hypothetical protein PHP08_00445 [Candidatus Dojkabacteria bacterium]|nr:hypothetical protein [Candidatus Dojkabacteria bacterium]
MNQSENNVDEKNELITEFLDRLVSLRKSGNYNEIEEMLIKVDEKKEYKHENDYSNTVRYIDNDSIVDVRIWSDYDTRKNIKILHYVCSNRDICISLNNKILKLWLYDMDSEMSKFFYKARKIYCEKEYRLSLSVEYKLWKEFISRCDTLNITITQGFKSCINDFIEHKTCQSYQW